MKYDYDREIGLVDVMQAAEYMKNLVGFEKSLAIPGLIGDDFAFAILAYRDQAEGKVLNLRPELREAVNKLTEILVEHSRKVDEPAEPAKSEFALSEAEIKEQLSPVLSALVDLGVPEDTLAKAVKFTAVVTETLVDLVGDEELAVEIYDQLDPAYAPIAILAYRKQAEGYEFAPDELEPEVRKEVDRLTEILVELSRREDREESEDVEPIKLPFDALPPEVEERIDRLVKSLTKAFGNRNSEEAEHIDHYEDYRVNAEHWVGREDSGYAYGEDEESAHQRLQEDIVRAAHKRQGYVLATREVWAKPVAKTEDGRWVFETEYGLEYLDFEDYGFEPEFEDEESYVDFD